ncbi:MAG: hypothetical protein R2754_08770 [Microthrixaceae bacterium]
MDLTAALRPVVAALEASGTPYAIVGSTAAAAWGVVRPTRDVDLVALLSPGEMMDSFLDHLAGSDLYVPFAEARRAAQEGGSFNIIHAGSGGKVDVFVGRDDFARERLSRRVGDEVLGITTWVATPEDVILAKLQCRLASRSEVQWRDCVEIAATQDLDLPYMRSWANRLGIDDDLQELVHAVETG